MSQTYRLARLAAAAASAIALTACASGMRVNSYTETGMNLAQYRTYDFAPADSVSTGDPRLDNNEFYNERMQAAIAQRMNAMGFERSASPNRDLLVHYHGSFSQQIDLNGLDQQYGDCRPGDCRPFVYEAGTITVDFVDARTNRLVWRGWAESSVDGVIDDQAWLEQKVDDAVAEILKRVPPRG